jgi:endonuclease YncB( thermonuclease family)
VGPLAATVIRVIDGDTLIVSLRIRTRTDAPEPTTPAGRARAAALASKLRRGRAVRLIPYAADPWGRMVADVTTGTVGAQRGG